MHTPQITELSPTLKYKTSGDKPITAIERQQAQGWERTGELVHDAGVVENMGCVEGLVVQ